MPGPIISVCLAATLALTVRLPFIGRTVYPDEGGYLLVVRHWHSHGPFLYGNFFVDRPPLLMVLYRLSDAIGGVEPLRLFAAFSVAGMAVAAGWGGWMIGGARGARWASFIAAVLASSPLLDATEADGEILAVPIVMVSCVLMIAALRPAQTDLRRHLYAMLAGLTGTAALLVKQNLVDALVFAVVLLAGSAARKTLSWAAASRAFTALLAGAAVPVLGVVGWATFASTGVHDLWFALYGFRTQAFHVIMSHSFTAPERRLDTLVIVAVQTGMFLLVAVYLLAQLRTQGPRQPLSIATVCMLAAAILGIAIGASYWLHYLIELIPALALAAADLARASARSVIWAARTAVVVTVAASVIAVGSAVTSPPTLYTRKATAVAEWLQRAAEPADSIFVTYGHADIVAASGLRPPAYPYLWSLPMRALDPTVTQLSGLLEKPERPTWLVVWNHLNSWHIDDSGHLQSVITTNYSVAAEVCGHTVYLAKGERRERPPQPVCH